VVANQILGWTIGGAGARAKSGTHIWSTKDGTSLDARREAEQLPEGVNTSSTSEDRTKRSVIDAAAERVRDGARGGEARYAGATAQGRRSSGTRQGAQALTFVLGGAALGGG